MANQRLNERLQKVKKGADWFLTSPFFVLLMAVIVLISYYCALDLLAIWFVMLSAIAMLFVCNSLMPLIVIFFFLQILTSPQKSTVESAYFLQPAVLGQVLGLVVCFILIAVYRFVISIKREGFHISSALWGMVGFAVVLLLNGIFAQGYTFKNLLFGLILAACFLGVFLLMHQCLHVGKNDFLYLSVSLIILSAVLIIELIVKYCTTEGIFHNGTIVRGLLMFGWGTYNSLGMLLCLILPAVFWLAYRYKYGFFFTMYAFVVLAAIVFSQSRQCILAGGIEFLICYIILLVKGKHRLINGGILLVVVVALAIFVGLEYETIATYTNYLMASVFDQAGQLNGAGRVRLWKIGIHDYSLYPVFGIGFYGSTMLNLNSYGGYYTLFPSMYHNTIIQILASCGSVGLLAYAVHRTQSILSFFKHPTTTRAYLAVMLFAMLFINLFDVHIFCIFSTLLYGALIALFFKTEQPAPFEVQVNEPLFDKGTKAGEQDKILK
jgi:hypothetical protein